MKKRMKMFGMICMSVFALAIMGCSNNNDYIDGDKSNNDYIDDNKHNNDYISDNKNEKDDEQKYVWLQVSSTSSSEISYSESQRKWIYYNDPMDYKYMDEVRNETEMNGEKYLTTITVSATSNGISLFQTSNEFSITYELKYFKELLPICVPKNVYMKYSYTDGREDEITEVDYNYEYLESENGLKVIKVTSEDSESDVYATYKIKDDMIVESSSFINGKINARSKTPDDEFLAELGLYETYSYVDVSDQPVSTKYILKEKTQNYATVGVETTIPSELLDYYDGYYVTYVTDEEQKYKRFAYPFSN